MATQGSILELFSEEEKQLLQKLESQRIVLRRKPVLWILVISLFGTITALMAGIHELTQYQDSSWPVVVVLVITLGFFGAVAWLSFKFPERDTISWKYKRMMLRRLVPKFLPGWVSSSSHRLMNEDIRKSGLFRDKANRIAREDYLFGPAGKVVAEVYQIALQTESKDVPEKKGKGILDVTSNHFYGFFYRVHCPVIFPCDVWVFPRQRKIESDVDDWAEISHGKYAHSTARKNIKTGDAQFDEHFSVYTSDPSRVLLILTDERRKNLVEVDRLFSTACAISYTENKVYAMIGFSDDPLDILMKREIGETLLQHHADELGRMKDVAMLISGL
ncbi:MAG: DUF3137 domain-containing protein [Bacteroidetes bacterium]|nr:DUF3137 domain-containing protein [Bacteroidota bacterium]